MNPEDELQVQRCLMDEAVQQYLRTNKLDELDIHHERQAWFAREDKFFTSHPLTGPVLARCNRVRIKMVPMSRKLVGTLSESSDLRDSNKEGQLTFFDYKGNSATTNNLSLGQELDLLLSCLEQIKYENAVKAEREAEMTWDPVFLPTDDALDNDPVYIALFGSDRSPGKNHTYGEAFQAYRLKVLDRLPEHWMTETDDKGIYLTKDPDHD